MHTLTPRRFLFTEFILLFMMCRGNKHSPIIFSLSNAVFSISNQTSRLCFAVPLGQSVQIFCLSYSFFSVFLSVVIMFSNFHLLVALSTEIRLFFFYRFNSLSLLSEILVSPLSISFPILHGTFCTQICCILQQVIHGIKITSKSQQWAFFLVPPHRKDPRSTKPQGYQRNMGG